MIAHHYGTTPALLQLSVAAFPTFPHVPDSNRQLQVTVAETERAQRGTGGGGEVGEVGKRKAKTAGAKEEQESRVGVDIRTSPG